MSRSSLEAGTHVPAVLVFGYGNPSRGDDALGPLLIEQMEARFSRETERAGEVEYLTDFQLQVEHALDLVGRQLVLFVDAHMDCPAPWQLSLLAPANDASYSTHAISPAAVLQVYQHIHAAEPPPSFLLGIRGERFELGEPLSQSAEAHLASALDLVAGLCRSPSKDAWLNRCR